MAKKPVPVPAAPEALDDFFGEAVYALKRDQIEAALAAGARFEPKDGSDSVLMWNCNFDNKLTKRDVERIKLLLEMGANPLYVAKQNGRDALHQLSFEPDHDALDALLKASKGKLKPRPDKDGNTPLHFACWYRDDPKYAERLLKLGNPVDAKNEREERPIHVALENGRPKLAAFFASKGARLDDLDRFAEEQGPKSVALLAKLRSAKK